MSIGLFEHNKTACTAAVAVLTAPKYIMTVLSYQKDLDKYTKKLNRTCDVNVHAKADGLDEIFNKHMTEKTGKYMVFMQRAEAINECIPHVDKWLGRVDANPYVYFVRTTEPQTSCSFPNLQMIRTYHICGCYSALTRSTSVFILMISIG